MSLSKLDLLAIGITVAVFIAGLLIGRLASVAPLHRAHRGELAKLRVQRDHLVATTHRLRTDLARATRPPDGPSPVPIVPGAGHRDPFATLNCPPSAIGADSLEAMPAWLRVEWNER
jgi:hypothetical protein